MPPHSWAQERHSTTGSETLVCFSRVITLIFYPHKFVVDRSAEFLQTWSRPIVTFPDVLQSTAHISIPLSEDESLLRITIMIDCYRRPGKRWLYARMIICRHFSDAMKTRKPRILYPSQSQSYIKTRQREMALGPHTSFWDVVLATGIRVLTETADRACTNVTSFTTHRYLYVPEVW
jgi:hypothetical protein